MLPYFPFGDAFDLKMGTSSLRDELNLIECDEYYQSEVLHKRQLLHEDHPYYFKAAPVARQAQWEVLDIVLHSLAKHYPTHFVLTKHDNQWHWRNNLLQEEQSFVFGDEATLPLQPLDWVGRQVQEDLLILDATAHLIGGQLCFPSGWSLEEKMNRHFLEIHAPLPALMNPMMQTAGKLMERIPVGKPIQRNNWGFRVTAQLDLSSRHSSWYRTRLQEVSSSLTNNTIGDEVFIRIEHQTLTKLPLSGCVLFTIHTYNNALAREVKDPARAKALLTFLQDVPPDLLEYKLMTPFIQPLLSYLKFVAAR